MANVYELTKDRGTCCMRFNTTLCEGVCGKERDVRSVGNLLLYEAMSFPMCSSVGLTDPMFGMPDTSHENMCNLLCCKSRNRGFEADTCANMISVK